MSLSVTHICTRSVSLRFATRSKMRSNNNSSNGSTFASFTERLKSFTKKSVKWPHPASFVANPNSLAAAGFYFSPSEDNKDAVSCFICQKGLADWDPTDNPAAIHFEKCSTCPWAILKCTTDIPDSKGRITFEASRLPSSNAMEKARLETFTPGGKSCWPHDGRNKGPSSKLMAKAGFIYTPISSSKKDDTCSCIYCGIELGGWQTDDDPMEEHHRRQEKNGPCPFFNVREASPSSQPNKKAKVAGTKSKAKPKAKSKSRSKLPPPETALEDSSVSATDAPNPVLIPVLSLEEEEYEESRKREEQIESRKQEQQTEPQEQEQQIEPQEQEGRLESPELEKPSPPEDPQEQKRPHKNEKSREQGEPQGQEKSREGMKPLDQGGEKREQTPIPLVHILTDAERSMTVEQWIRAEMERQYEILKSHGRSQIEAFKSQALEVAKRIEQL